MGNDLMGRIQCVAKTVRVEDFDISVSRMLQQGGVFAASQLAQRYPQIAFWINIAAAALDFILKITNKAPLRIVPTVVTSTESAMVNSLQKGLPTSAKISLFAESQPNDNGFITAYPLVFHKWQASADPELINLPMPVLMDSCLHAGQNIIRTSDIVNDWMTDNFTKDFQITISSSNGFRKEFPLKKNVGFGGWELMLTKEEVNAIPKINMQLEAKITGNRGFNKIQSPDFNVQLPSINSWSVEPNSQKSFTVGGKRMITLKNPNGGCRCLETVIYKPSFGGEFVFDAKRLMYSLDGKDVSLEIDTAKFSSGAGQLELRQYGGELVNLSLELYPLLPTISNVKVAKGDTQATIIGERLEQVQAIRINGRRAIFKGGANGDFKGGLPTATTATTTPNQTDMYRSPTVLSEKTFVFEDSSQWQDSNSLSLDLELNNQRIIKHSTLFAVSSARPVIVASADKEIEAFVVNYQNNNARFSNNFADLPIFPIETSAIGINLQNALTDYDFKIENLQIETRIENAQVNPFNEANISFEVLDWRSIRLNIQLSDQAKKMLGGRRIQFRIKDSKRGDSDWYSIKQTFVRIPQITSLKCLPNQTKQCELIGTGINYIQQISLDNGKTWFPEQPTGLVSNPSTNELESVLIPNSSGNTRSVKIRLRDFSKAQDLPLSSFMKTIR